MQVLFLIQVNARSIQFPIQGLRRRPLSRNLILQRVHQESGISRLMREGRADSRFQVARRIIGRSLNVRHEPAFAYDVCERTGRIRRVERNGASTRERGSTRIFRCSLMTGPAKGPRPASVRGLIYEWDQTSEEVDHADWPSPTPL